jgi:biopolymer transport protein ExbD
VIFHRQTAQRQQPFLLTPLVSVMFLLLTYFLSSPILPDS